MGSLLNSAFERGRFRYRFKDIGTKVDSQSGMSRDPFGGVESLDQSTRGDHCKMGKDRDNEYNKGERKEVDSE